MTPKALERKGKRLALALLGPLLDARPLVPETLAGRRLRRILVVRQDERLGNLLLITPLLENLKKVQPQAHVVALVSSRFAEVLEGNPDVDAILPFDKRRLWRDPFRMWQFISHLRSYRFDLAIDCGPFDGLSVNNSLMTYLSRAPFRLGHRRGQSHLFLNLQVPRAQEERTEVDHHLDLLRHVYGDVPTGQTKIYLTIDERRRAALRWRQLGLGDEDRAVGLHVGGRGSKRWPAERFVQLASRLMAERTIRVILFPGPDDADVLRTFQSQAQPRLVIAPQMSIRELAGQLQRCDVFVSGDTGPMHLAQAVGTPTVAIFRVPNYQRYGQQGPRHRIVYRPGGDVSVDDVLAATAELLDTLPRGKPGV